MYIAMSNIVYVYDLYTAYSAMYISNLGWRSYS